MILSTFAPGSHGPATIGGLAMNSYVDRTWNCYDCIGTLEGTERVSSHMPIFESDQKTRNSQLQKIQDPVQSQT